MAAKRHKTRKKPATFFCDVCAFLRLKRFSRAACDFRQSCAEHLSKLVSSAPLCELLLNGLNWFENLSDQHARRKSYVQTNLCGAKDVFARLRLPRPLEKPIAGGCERQRVETIGTLRHPLAGARSHGESSFSTYPGRRVWRLR